MSQKKLNLPFFVHRLKTVFAFFFLAVSHKVCVVLVVRYCFCWNNAFWYRNTQTFQWVCATIACRCNGSQIYSECAQRGCFEHVACEVTDIHTKSNHRGTDVCPLQGVSMVGKHHFYLPASLPSEQQFGRRVLLRVLRPRSVYMSLGRVVKTNPTCVKHIYFALHR